MNQMFSTLENFGEATVAIIVIASLSVLVIAASMTVLTLFGTLTRMVVLRFKRFSGLSDIYDSMDDDYIRLARKLRISDTAGRYMSFMATPVLTVILCLAVCIFDRKHVNKG